MIDDISGPKLLLKSREAAKLLSVSERTLWNLTQRGELPCVRIGKRGIRYDPKDLSRWLESRKTTKPAPELELLSSNGYHES